MPPLLLRTIAVDPQGKHFFLQDHRLLQHGADLTDDKIRRVQQLFNIIPLQQNRVGRVNREVPLVVAGRMQLYDEIVLRQRPDCLLDLVKCRHDPWAAVYRPQNRLFAGIQPQRPQRALCVPSGVEQTVKGGLSGWEDPVCRESLTDQEFFLQLVDSRLTVSGLDRIILLIHHSIPYLQRVDA